MEFDEWETKVKAMLPWPDVYEVLEAVESCDGDDRPTKRLALLRELVAAHYEASRRGVFNDE